MAMTWLQILQAAADELGLSPRPVAVASATDTQTRQLAALSRRCGDKLMRVGDWSTLAAVHTLTTEPPIELIGIVASGSPVVTGLSSTAGLTAEIFAVSGDYITNGTRLLTVDSATQVTLDQPATASGSSSLLFGKDVYPVPDEWNNFIDRTFWDRSRRWELVGPMSPQEYQWMVSGIVATGPRRRFRKVGRGTNAFRIWPPPTAIDSPATLAFEYSSLYWATDAAGVPKAVFTTDTDTCVFPDNLMIVGLKWMFMQAKGFEFDFLRQEWSALVDQALGQDKGSRTLSLSASSWPVLIGPGNVPDTNFGQ